MAIIDNPQLINLPWDWNYMSENLPVKIEFIIHPQLENKWKWQSLSRNRTLTMKFISDNSSPKLMNKWSWPNLAKNPSLDTLVDNLPEREDLDFLSFEDIKLLLPQNLKQN